MLIVLILLVPVLALAAMFLRAAYGPVSAEDLDAMHAIAGVTATASTTRLFTAYLSRARRYRTSWSVGGWLSAIVLDATLGGRIGIGNGNGQPVYADLLLMGFGGYMLGAVISELHHLRRRGHGVRTATIVPRRLGDYAPRAEQTFMRVLAGIAFASAVVAVALGAMATATLIALAAVGVWAIIEWTQRAVVHRPRPALPADLAAADDAIRGASVATLTYGGIGLVALLIASTASRIVVSSSSTWFTTSLGLLAFTLGLLSIAAAFKTRRVVWPKRRLQKDVTV